MELITPPFHIGKKSYSSLHGFQIKRIDIQAFLLKDMLKQFQNIVLSQSFTFTLLKIISLKKLTFISKMVLL